MHLLNVAIELLYICFGLFVYLRGFNGVPTALHLQSRWYAV